MKIKHMLIILLCAFILMACDKTDKNIFASGTFYATEVIVSSQLNGEIQKLNLSEGDFVQEGQILGNIDSEQLQLQKQQLLSSIKSVKSRRPDISVQLSPLAQQIKTAKKEKERIGGLLEIGVATEKQFDDMSALLLSLEKQYSALNSSLEKGHDGISEDLFSLDIQVKLLEKQIDNSIIKSPISGRVLAQYAQQGEYALPGKAIVKIADLQRIFLRAYVSSSQLTELKLGQSVNVVADFGEKEKRTYSGILTWISDKAEFTPKTIQTRDERSNLVYALKVDIENDGYLKIGMYGGMEISNE